MHWVGCGGGAVAGCRIRVPRASLHHHGNPVAHIMVTILLGLSNSADPFFSDRNLENSGPSSGSVRNFFSIFFNRLEVSQVFFHSAARLVATKKTEFQFFRIPDGHKVPSEVLKKGC